MNTKSSSRPTLRTASSSVLSEKSLFPTEVSGSAGSICTTRNYQRQAERNIDSWQVEKKVYTAHAVATGGREGASENRDDGLPRRSNSSSPKTRAAPARAKNPEQPFATGFAACFIRARSSTFRASKRCTSNPAPSSTSSVIQPKSARPERNTHASAIEVELEGLHPPGSTHEKPPGTCPRRPRRLP